MHKTDPSRRLVAALVAILGFAPRALAETQEPFSGNALEAGSGAEPPPVTIETADDPYNRMTAPVMINGEGPFQFVVDTGANRSVLCSEIASKLGLPPGKPIILNGVARAEAAQTVQVDRVTVGEAEASDSNVNFAVLPRQSIGADGILGIDRFTRRRITLDFRNRRLIVDPVVGTLGPLSVSVPAILRSGQLMIVQANLAGVKLLAFLDSGAERTIGNQQLYELASFPFATTKFYQNPVVSVTGATTPGQTAFLPLLRLGGMSITNIFVTFADLHVFKIWKLTEPSLLIGVDLMSLFDAITLDFKRARVIFHLRDDQAQPDKVMFNTANTSRIPRKH